MNDLAYFLFCFWFALGSVLNVYSFYVLSRVKKELNDYKK